MKKIGVLAGALFALAVLSTSHAAFAQASAHGHWVVDPKGIAR